MSERLPAGDGRDTAASGPVIRAEQALLGAVMADPGGQGAVLDAVGRDDMFRPYHGQVLAAMQRLRARGQAPGPLAVRAELGRDPDLPPSVAADGALLAGLLGAAPRAGHAPAYAAMVIDHGIRQRLRLAGSRMVQAAEAGDLDSAARVTAEAARAVEACQRRWAGLPEPMRRELPAAAGQRARQGEEAAWQLRAAGEEIARARDEARAGDGSGLAGRLSVIARSVAAASAAVRSAGSAGPRAAEGRPAGAEAEGAGVQFLRDLAAGPGQVAAVRGWLSPRDLARPAHGQVYALIRDMHAAGKAVDPVTIAWEAARRGIPADAAELEGGTAGFVVADAREVWRHGVLARVGAAGREISGAAGDPQKPLGVLLREAADRVHGLELEPGRRPDRDVARTAGQPGRQRGRPAARDAGIVAERG